MNAADLHADACYCGHLRFAIANCISGEHRANCPRREGSAAAPTVSTHIVPLEERESIEQQVARTLRELIVDGKLPEGTPRIALSALFLLVALVFVYRSFYKMRIESGVTATQAATSASPATH